MATSKFKTLTEAAEELRLHPKTLTKFARRGDIRSVRATPAKRAAYLFTDADIADFLARNTAAHR